MSSTTNHNTFNIIRNNIYTMKPLQFLNTFCINNPSLEQVVNCIQDSDLTDEEVKGISRVSFLLSEQEKVIKIRINKNFFIFYYLISLFNYYNGYVVWVQSVFRPVIRQRY